MGKRSALLDLARQRSELEQLLATADVVVAGYRPHALDRYGLSPGQLAERRPGVVLATLSAWGQVGPWGDRRGFDSIVQAAYRHRRRRGGAGRRARGRCRPRPWTTPPATCSPRPCSGHWPDS